MGSKTGQILKMIGNERNNGKRNIKAAGHGEKQQLEISNPIDIPATTAADAIAKRGRTAAAATNGSRSTRGWIGSPERIEKHQVGRPDQFGQVEPPGLPRHEQNAPGDVEAPATAAVDVPCCSITVSTDIPGQGEKGAARHQSLRRQQPYATGNQQDTAGIITVDGLLSIAATEQINVSPYPPRDGFSSKRT